MCKVAGIGRIEGTGSSDHYAVVPSKDGKLIETGDEVPAGSDVASYKDAKGQDREGVHRALLPAEAHADPIRRRAVGGGTLQWAVGLAEVAAWLCDVRSAAVSGVTYVQQKCRAGARQAGGRE